MNFLQIGVKDWTPSNVQDFFSSIDDDDILKSLGNCFRQHNINGETLEMKVKSSASMISLAKDLKFEPELSLCKTDKILCKLKKVKQLHDGRRMLEKKSDSNNEYVEMLWGYLRGVRTCYGKGVFPIHIFYKLDRIQRALLFTLRQDDKDSSRFQKRRIDKDSIIYLYVDEILPEILKFVSEEQYISEENPPSPENVFALNKQDARFYCILIVDCLFKNVIEFCLEAARMRPQCRFAFRAVSCVSWLMSPENPFFKTYDCKFHLHKNSVTSANTSTTEEMPDNFASETFRSPTVQNTTSKKNGAFHENPFATDNVKNANFHDQDGDTRGLGWHEDNSWRTKLIPGSILYFQPSLNSQTRQHRAVVVCVQSIHNTNCCKYHFILLLFTIIIIIELLFVYFDTRFQSRVLHACVLIVKTIIFVAIKCLGITYYRRHNYLYVA